jgi:hypothetical protein
MRDDLAGKPLPLRVIVSGTRRGEEKGVSCCNERFQVGDELSVGGHFDARSRVRKILALVCCRRFGFRCRFTVYQVDIQAC